MSRHQGSDETSGLAHKAVCGMARGVTGSRSSAHDHPLPVIAAGALGKATAGKTIHVCSSLRGVKRVRGAPEGTPSRQPAEHLQSKAIGHNGTP